MLGGDLEHVVDGGEDVVGVEEEDGLGGAPRRGASWVLPSGFLRAKMEPKDGQVPAPERTNDGEA